MGNRPLIFAGGLYDLSGVPSPERRVDYELQAHGLEAWLSMLYEDKADWLKGVSLWDLTPVTMTQGELAGIWHTQGISVYGKPAAEVVKRYYVSH